jgi:tyrosine-protein phosphatase YwqE
VASDAHSSEVRTPHMTEIRRYLTDRCDSTYANILLTVNPDRIAHDLPLLGFDEP